MFVRPPVGRGPGLDPNSKEKAGNPVWEERAEQGARCLGHSHASNIPVRTQQGPVQGRNRENLHPILLRAA